MEVTTLDRFVGWLYTGPPGRFVSFSIDVVLTLAALALYAVRSGLRRISSPLRRP